MLQLEAVIQIIPTDATRTGDGFRKRFQGGNGERKVFDQVCEFGMGPLRCIGDGMPEQGNACWGQPSRFSQPVGKTGFASNLFESSGEVGLAPAPAEVDCGVAWSLAVKASRTPGIAG